MAVFIAPCCPGGNKFVFLILFAVCDNPAVGPLDAVDDDALRVAIDLVIKAVIAAIAVYPFVESRRCTR
jgi:hypothetical protein